MDATVIRASAVSGYADCPRRAAARLFRQEILAAGYTLREETRGVGAAVGTSLHRAAALVLTEKAKTGTAAPASVARDAAIETLREHTREGIHQFDRETPTIVDAERQLIRMADSFYAELAPKIRPILVEHRLEASIPWTTQNLVASGKSDVIAIEPGAIDDHKGGKRVGYHAGQAGLYSLLARTPRPELPEGLDVQKLNINWTPRVSLKKPQPPAQQIPLAVARCEQIAFNLIRHIDTDLRTFRFGDKERGLLPGDPSAFLGNPSSMLCSARWCSAHSGGPNGWCHEHDVSEPGQEAA